MSFSLIAAVGKNLELGQDNQLIFHIKEDMAFFKQTTMGHPVLMGRKTWESIGRPLAGRQNLVVSRHALDLPDGVELVSDLPKFIADHSATDEEIFVIGGAQLYTQTLPFAKTLYLTEVEATAKDADTFFPSFDSTKFNRTVLGGGTSQNLQYHFIKYERKSL